MGGIGQAVAKQVGQTGIPIYNVVNACATGATAVRTAYLEIAAGEADMGLAIGAEQMGKMGLLAGNASFLFKQTVAVLIASAWGFVFTYAMLVVINKFTPVKVTEDEQTAGLDTALHGEDAYDFGVAAEKAA